MTDRELLEAAAKAAGVRHIEYTNDYDGKNGLVMCDEVGRHQNDWNPLNDDGDALRLAVKLGICIGPNFDGDRAIADGGEFSQHYVFEMFGGDKDAATRRAIVRCAAAMAKEKAE